MTVEAPECIPVGTGDRTLRFHMPGGAILEAVPTIPATIPPDSFTLAATGLGQLGSAMAPIAPIFRMVDAILAIKRFAEAVASNPFSAGDALGDVLEAADGLVSIIPQASVPLLVIDLVGALDRLLEGVQQQIDGLLAQAARIEEARALLAQAPTLSVAITCAEGQLVDMTANLDAALGPARGILAILGLLTAMAGLPAPPGLDAIDPDPANLATTRTAIDRARSLLAVFVGDSRRPRTTRA